MPFAVNEGARIYWRREGEQTKPALVLLTSIGTDQSLYDRAAAHLAREFQLIRMDTRGHGASDAPESDYSLGLLASDVLTVMDAAGLSSASVCGVSLGGMVAMELAIKAPHRIEKLVLACTSAQMDRDVWRKRITTVKEGGMTAVADTVLDRFFSPGFRRRQPQMVASTRDALLSMSPSGYMGCGSAIRDMDLAGRISAIKAQTLVIGGEKDISTPYPDHGAKIAAAIPGASAVMLDAAHLACAETPDAFALSVTDFIQRAPAGEIEAAKEALFTAGLKPRRSVLGDAWVDAALATRTAFNSDYQEMITRVAWGEVWTRPGLDHRTRRLLVLAICASLARWEEFRLHVKAGLEQDGFSTEELKETLMQIAIYAGVPAGNTAFHEAADVMSTLSESRV